MRQYAAFFEWHDRPRKELGVLEKLIESGSVAWNSPQSFSPDPPDCVCHDDRGGAIAVELAEGVSQEAAARNAKGEQVMQWWDTGDISTHVRDLLARKDSVCAACGTHLWSEPQNKPKLAVLLAATLHKHREFKPVAHIWTKRALPWVTIPPGVATYATQPADRTELVRLWQQATGGDDGAT